MIVEEFTPFKHENHAAKLIHGDDESMTRTHYVSVVPNVEHDSYSVHAGSEAIVNASPLSPDEKV